MIIRKTNITKVATLVIATVTLLCSFSVKVFAQEANEVEKGYVVLSSHTSRLNVRKEASTKSKVLGQLEAGDVVEVIGEKSGFYEIKFSDGSAYVSKSYVTIADKDTDKYELMSAAVITAASSSSNRNYNMSLACSKIDGLVLEPDEQFDWYGENGVGNASKEKGYKKANIIVNKKYVAGYGGGVCQVSTALYNAIYDLGIEPDVLCHHSLESSYVAKGMDATVAYGSKDFKFTNSMDYSIEIEAFTNKSQVVILLYKVLE